MTHPDIIHTVDVVLFTIKDERLHVALVKRNASPFDGQFSLPGGYIHAQDDDNCLLTADRVLKEKVLIDASYLEQLKTFSGKFRDPRGWSLSVVYFALVSCSKLLNKEIKLVNVDNLRSLPFDHEEIINYALNRIRNKSQYSSLPCYFLDKEFTLPEIQKIYEICINEPINKVTFRKKIIELGVVEEISGKLKRSGAFRPAQLYQLIENQSIKLTSKTITQCP